MKRIAGVLVVLAALPGALALAVPASERPVPRAMPGATLVLGVLGHGEWAMTVNARTGATARRRLPGGTLCHGDLVASGRRVAFLLARRSGMVLATLPLSLRGRPRVLAAASGFAASAIPGRLWVFGPGAGWRLGALREIDARGRTTFRPQETPPRGYLHGSAAGSLLIERGRRLHVWNPRSGRVVRRLPAGRDPRARPPARLRLGDYRAFARSHTGRWLFFSDERERLMALRRGAGRPQAIPGARRRTVMSIDLAR